MQALREIRSGDVVAPECQGVGQASPDQALPIIPGHQFVGNHRAAEPPLDLAQKAVFSLNFTDEDERDPTLAELVGDIPEDRLRTWLPRLVAEFRHRYPAAVILPEVGVSHDLLERLQEGTIDLIVIPDTPTPADLKSVRLKEVMNTWVAGPGVFDPGQLLPLAQLSDFPLLVKGRSSGYALLVRKWGQRKICS